MVLKFKRPSKFQVQTEVPTEAANEIDSIQVVCQISLSLTRRLDVLPGEKCQAHEQAADCWACLIGFR